MWREFEGFILREGDISAKGASLLFSTFILKNFKKCLPFILIGINIKGSNKFLGA
jgi:hypothetical protein